MAKALKKNPRSLRLGAAEIEAADVLGKPTEHLVARSEKPAPKRSRTVVCRSDQETDRRIREMFGGDSGDPEAELLELGGNPHVGGGSQDIADVTGRPFLRLSIDEIDNLKDAFPTVRFASVDVSVPVRAGIVSFLRAAPPRATVEQLLDLAEHLS